MTTNLQVTPSFGARVLIKSTAPKSVLSEKTIEELIDRGEVIANDYSYIKVMVSPTNTNGIYQLNNDTLIMKNGVHKIIKEESFAKKKEVVPRIHSMFKTVDNAFKNLFSHSQDL